MTNPDYIQTYFTQLEQTIHNISHEEIWSVIQVLMDAWCERKQVFLLGNGGSAATATHMANDLNKLTIVDGKPRFKAIALTDNIPLITAWGNDTDFENIFVEQLLNFIEREDVVVGISASGNSPNVLKAIEVAKTYNAVSIGFTGDTGGELKKLVDHYICIPHNHICIQEDAHMILNHVISNTLKALIETKL